MKKYGFFLILFLLAVSVVFSGGQSEAVSVPAVDGVIEYFEGDVFVNDLPADFGMKVPFGAVIKTGPEAYCEVVFENGNIFRIMEATVAEIRLSVESPEIEIKSGAFAALFTKLAAFTSDEPFRVRTSTTLAGVRGTAFFVKIEDPDSTYICICNGSLEMTEPDGSKPADFSSGHHKAARYKNVNGSIEVSKAPLLYHGDEDMNRLAEKIGEEIRWY